MRGDRWGGFQYSESFLEALWKPYRERLRNALIINCFQLYPPSIVWDDSLEKWFFIDQTLLQLFDHYGTRASVGRRIAEEAIKREREGYQAATGVMVHSHWAARSVVEDYGVMADRVHVVVPGANLDLEAYSRWEQEEGERRAERCSGYGPAGPVRFVFVGKEWKRKGLHRLMAGFRLARHKGCRSLLRVIGCSKESLPKELTAVEGIEWCGFVDKEREAGRFLHLVAQCDVGCLLSQAEAGGIAVREYHALGLAVLGTTAGGSPEHACAEASWLLEPEAPDEAVGQAILKISRERARLEAAREAAWSKRHSFLYPATVQRMLELVNPLTPHPDTARA